MEKTQGDEKLNQSGDEKNKLWDCGSSLYDSFELKSFSRQLDSAIISSRTMSMPHLSSRVVAPPSPPPPPPQPQVSKKFTNKFSKSFSKLVKSLFSSKHQNSASNNFYVHDDKSDDHVLSSIPEVLEFDVYDEGVPPELSSFVGRSRSERFAAPSIGISCA